MDEKSPSERRTFGRGPPQGGSGGGGPQMGLRSQEHSRRWGVKAQAQESSPEAKTFKKNKRAGSAEPAEVICIKRRDLRALGRRLAEEAGLPGSAVGKCSGVGNAVQVVWAVGTQNLLDECGRKRRSVRRTFEERWERRDVGTPKVEGNVTRPMAPSAEETEREDRGWWGGISSQRAELTQTWSLPKETNLYRPHQRVRLASS
ncbi:uncharacterized protein LOC108299855 [Cebus imitator]|uniref:uncharacterized protein LOC108299855 n=1 Tax=Cebus imitator TaxID=2715852 RepID=UPI001897D7FB|nr:uncharacterized protein LOC108299855 [Cebus imitator]